MAPDCFALLDEPRRPWIDPETLKARFQRLSGAAHPDRVHAAGVAAHADATQHYASLSAAYQRLRDPKERLLHLIELERGHKPAGIERVPPELMDLFSQVGQLNQELKRFLAGRSQVSSPLLRVRWFEQGLAWTERVDALLASLETIRNQLSGRLQELNSAWDTAPAPGHADRAALLPLDELERIFRTMSYLNRWTSQLQEQAVQLRL